MTSGSSPAAAEDVSNWLNWFSSMATSSTSIPLLSVKAAAMSSCAARRSGRFSSVQTTSGPPPSPSPSPPSSEPQAARGRPRPARPTSSTAGASMRSRMPPRASYRRRCRRGADSSGPAESAGLASASIALRLPSTRNSSENSCKVVAEPADISAMRRSSRRSGPLVPRPRTTVEEERPSLSYDRGPRATALWSPEPPVVVSFTGPRGVRLVDEDRGPLLPGTVRVRTLYSGISAGTELTAYRGSNPYLTKTWDPGRRLFTEGGSRSATRSSAGATARSAASSRSRPTSTRSCPADASGTSCTASGGTAARPCCRWRPPTAAWSRRPPIRSRASSRASAPSPSTRCWPPSRTSARPS